MLIAMRNGAAQAIPCACRRQYIPFTGETSQTGHKLSLIPHNLITMTSRSMRHRLVHSGSAEIEEVLDDACAMLGEPTPRAAWASAAACSAEWIVANMLAALAAEAVDPSALAPIGHKG